MIAQMAHSPFGNSYRFTKFLTRSGTVGRQAHEKACLVEKSVPSPARPPQGQPHSRPAHDAGDTARARAASPAPLGSGAVRRKAAAAGRCRWARARPAHRTSPPSPGSAPRAPLAQAAGQRAPGDCHSGPGAGHGADAPPATSAGLLSPYGSPAGAVRHSSRWWTLRARGT